MDQLKHIRCLNWCPSIPAGVFQQFLVYVAEKLCRGAEMGVGKHWPGADVLQCYKQRTGVAVGTKCHITYCF